MTSMKFILAIFALFAVICLASAKGKLSWGDKCDVVSGAFSVVTGDDSKTCNSDQGLLCTGTCTCLPTQVWDKGYTLGLFGTGNCVVGANGPCVKETSTCVSNAKCGDVNVCQCNDGYHPHDSQCVSGSSKVSGISGLAFFGTILFYYILGD